MTALLIGIVLGAALASLVVLLFLKRKSQPPAALPAVAEQNLPTQIAIVDELSRPLITIEPVRDSTAFDKAKPVPSGSDSISRLSALMQAAPSVLTAASASGKNLMEVVINGDLVLASKGGGYRAMTKGPNGIESHANLFDVKNLQNLINAAAIWQVASVLVAQKHLADISKKLDTIKEGVEALSSFLIEERRAHIMGTYRYLQQVFAALNAGGLPATMRQELERCERELIQILLHLQQEYQRIVDKRVEHTETLGTKELTADLHRKLDKLKEISRDIEMCVRTRIAAWHVLSLYPGDPEQKEARRQDIERSLDELKKLPLDMYETLTAEINGMKSRVNFSETLNERKAGLHAAKDKAEDALAGGLKSANESVAETSKLLLKHDQPTRIWLEFENGVLIQAREEAA